MTEPRVNYVPQQPTGNVVRDSALGLVPESLEPYLVLNKAVWSSGPLSAAELEMIRLRNARKVGCVFCKAVRYDEALNAGLTESKVAQIDDDHAASELSQREKLLLRFVDHYLEDPGALDAELASTLAAEFSAQEITHMSIAVVLFNTFSRCAVALGGMPEEELPLIKMSVPE